MESDLIQVVQLPIIQERLRTMKEAVDKQVSEALSLVCTADTLQAVKAKRAELTKQFRALEGQRMAVKSAVMEPWESFEATYRECISDPFKGADAQLKRKIGDVEAGIKKRCEDGLREYFEELCAAHHVEFLKLEQAGIVIDMASAKAKTPKKLREQIAAFVVGVSDSVDRISSLEDAEEIMVEYQRSLDAAGAICAVKERHQRIEEAKAFQEDRNAIRQQEDESVRKIEALAPPVQAELPKTVKCTFTVHTTMDKLKKLKEFLIMEGIEYE